MRFAKVVITLVAAILAISTASPLPKHSNGNSDQNPGSCHTPGKAPDCV